jgi:hypothetical protein
LAEREYTTQARQALTEAVVLAAKAEPVGSRAEALLLLFHSAFKISKEDASKVAGVLESSCSSTHWRVKRANKEIAKMLMGEIRPREFFW